MESSGARTRAWAIATAVVAVATIVAVTGYLAFRTVARMPEEVARTGAETLRDVAAAFRQGTVEIRFLRYATEIAGTTRLQFASLSQLEVFERKDSASLMWGQLALPDVIVQAAAPVEYTYFVDLQGSWALELRNGRIYVQAPPIEFNQPAIDASRLEYRVQEGSFLRDEDEATENLRSGLQAMARQRAAENVSLVRDTGRRKIEDFVRSWLLWEFAEGETLRVEVLFSDEASSAQGGEDSSGGESTAPAVHLDSMPE